jgi:hypothetical protein
MSKSLYSLILADEVVSEIDRLAYKMGTNRSNMINQILAEYVSYTTPEMRIGQIFSALEELLSPSDNFKTLLGTSSSVMNVRSSLDYKYNPSVKYTVELARDISDNIGTLKVSMRTQNSTLLLYLMEFYKLYAKIESSYISDTEYYLDGDKFARMLKLKSSHALSTSQLGNVIAEYIKMFDSCLKAFFYNVSNVQLAAYEIEKIIISYLNSSDVRI